MSDWLAETLIALSLNLATALSAVFQRDSYLFWPYLLSSFVIALIAWRWRPPFHARSSWKEFVAEYFSSKLWWHPSARADYWLYLANAITLPVIFAVLLVNERQIAHFVTSLFGAEQPTRGEAGTWARIAFTVLFFVAYDFGRFVAHCLLHDVPVLWEFHKIHHSAEVLTPMTSFRAHPLELVLMAGGSLLTTSLMTSVFNTVFGSVSFYTFMGLHVLLFMSNLIGNLRHSPVWISYGPFWGRWFISPAHHQLHHSSERRHIGCNRGFELAIWDRLYGTLYVPPKAPEQFRLGLGYNTEGGYHHLGRMYLIPFWAALQQWRRYFRRSA